MRRFAWRCWITVVNGYNWTYTEIQLVRLAWWLRWGDSWILRSTERRE